MFPKFYTVQPDVSDSADTAKLQIVLFTQMRRRPVEFQAIPANTLQVVGFLRSMKVILANAIPSVRDVNTYPARIIVLQAGYPALVRAETKFPSPCQRYRGRKSFDRARRIDVFGQCDRRVDHLGQQEGA